MTYSPTMCVSEQKFMAHTCSFQKKHFLEADTQSKIYYPVMQKHHLSQKGLDLLLWRASPPVSQQKDFCCLFLCEKIVTSWTAEEYIVSASKKHSCFLSWAVCVPCVLVKEFVSALSSKSLALKLGRHYT